jgi:transcriptional regulator with XRE-family HTH domain
LRLNIRSDIISCVNAAALLRDARHAAGLTQAELAARAGTSQATVSAYESGRKDPTVATLGRLLAACGSRLASERTEVAVDHFDEARLARAGRTLEQVLALAAELPARHEAALRFPRLAPRS